MTTRVHCIQFVLEKEMQNGREKKKKKKRKRNIKKKNSFVTFSNHEKCMSGVYIQYRHGPRFTKGNAKSKQKNTSGNDEKRPRMVTDKRNGCIVRI